MRGAVLVRNRGAGIVAILAALMSVVVLVAGAMGAVPYAVLEYPIIALLAALAAHLGWWKPKEKLAELHADDTGVHVDGVLVRERSKLDRAVILPRDRRPPMVEVHRKGDLCPLRVVLPTIEDAQAFVRTLGLDAREGMTIVRGAGKTVLIGADGLAIKSMFRRRFVPWADVVQLERMVPPGRETVSRGFFVHTRSGEAIRVNTVADRLREGAFDSDHYFLAAVASRNAARKSEPRAAQVALLRGGRPARAWLAALRTKASDGYRVAAMSDDEMLAVLEDPTASEQARAGAAVALAGDERMRARIRVASEAVAEPKLRVALDAALSEDDEALEKALESIS